MSDFLSAIGRSYIVSSLVPAGFFTLVASLIVRPWVHRLLGARSEAFWPTSDALIFFVVAAFIGFALYSINTSVYRLFEGYTISLPWSYRAHRRRLHQMLLERVTLENMLRRKDITGNDHEILRLRLLRLYEEFQRTFPSRPDLVMPTQLGNALRAYEEYTGLNFGIDGILVWPRLLEVASERFLNLHTDNNNKLTFVLNSALLSWLASGLSFVSFILYALGGIGSMWYAVGYCAVFVLGLIGGWGFYRTALPLAEEQGYLFRAGFDLFRFKLLEALRISELPQRPEDESAIWSSLQEYWWAGQRLVDLETDYDTEAESISLNFSFHHESPANAKNSDGGNLP
jgi:hypothetical protein